MSIKISTVQTMTTSDIPGNLEKYLEFIQKASDEGADIVHFSETTLTGYLGVELAPGEMHDWGQWEMAMQTIKTKCRELGIHAIVGTSSPNTHPRPYNSLIVIDDTGKEVCRYHKMFCTYGDLEHYTSGREVQSFRIKGVRCGLLICHDYRYPELYREYLKRGVQIVFHSFHQVHPAFSENTALMRKVSPAHLTSRAAENNMYVIANNCINKKEQWFNTQIINPNGSMRCEIPVNTEGMLTTEIDIEEEQFYNATRDNRFRAASGVLYSEL